MAATADSNNYFRVQIDKWSEMKEDDDIVENWNYCGFPWQIRATKDKDGGLFIELFSFKDDESNIWYCDVSMDCFIINHIVEGEKINIGHMDTQRLTPENVDDSMRDFVIESSLLDNSEFGYIKDDKIIIEVCITVHSKPGKRFRKKVEFDMFSPSHKSDGILVVEGKKVYVSKQLLSIHSPFFDRIFFGKFKEASESETEINDVILDEFEVLLKMLYRTGEQLRDENVEFILKLTDRFEMLSIMDDAEKYLIYSTNLNIHKKLALSDQYNLLVLQDQLLHKYTADLIRKLTKSDEYGKLTEETKDILFQKYIAFTSN
ncbi:hypothetical protein PMAYCL1PPCAC_24415 [Pristionchus mayeri]|uniref:BTB domain-containing protein n=1 Tax=Pristionchus mayeri TaxID=1317129 RepID=A0AAN5D1Q4_9BILA|nr:hypothetical protein PMAYCL1PPCAC_24415 [Pristionchus mayeri]